MGSAKFLQNNPEKLDYDEIKELANDILDSSKRLQKITENYLIFSRIEAISANKDKIEQLFNFKTNEPNSMLYDIGGFIANRYARDNDLEVDADINDIAIIMSSESFHKVIEELLDNAFKFSEPNTKIQVNSQLLDTMLNITIKDNGRGMSEKQITNVGALMQFERDVFEQQGVGLGLIISKKLVELHKGKFYINSKEQEGTTIDIYLPYEQILA
jgi:signal transduction histidine kinase